MADKKKNASQSATRDQMIAPKAISNEKGAGKSAKMAAQDSMIAPKEAAKNVKAAAREERKVQESKTVRRDNSKGSSYNKGPANWQVRLRTNRYVRFILDAYYELRHKVTWPSFNEARNMTIVVLLLSGAVALLLGIADYGLQNLYLLLIHLGGGK